MVDLALPCAGRAFLKMNDKEHINYPSRYAINEIVQLDMKFPLVVFMCKIRAVKFTESKVYYDIYVEFENGGSMIMRELDSVFVCDLDKPPHKAETV